LLAEQVSESFFLTYISNSYFQKNIISTGDALDTTKDVIQKRLQVVLKRPDLMQYLNLGGQTSMPANESEEYDKKNFKKTLLYQLLVKACVKVDENFSKTQFNAELSKYLKNAPNIKDGYNWVKKQGKKLKITDSQNTGPNGHNAQLQFFKRRCFKGIFC